MGQGSINQPGKIGSPIEGILSALQAVHSYYGIDTEKARQQLLASENKKAGAEAQTAAAEAEELKNYKETGQMGPLLAMKQGILLAPGSRPANAPSDDVPKLIPVQNQASPGAQTAVNDTGDTANDAGASPLAGHMQKISQVVPDSSGMVPRNQVRGMQIALPGGETVQGVAGPGLQKQQLELEELKQRIGNAAQDEARKGRAEKTGISEKFNSYAPVMEAKDDIASAQYVLNAFASGNEASIALAKTKLPLLAEGIKRLGGDGSIIDPQKLSAMFDDWKALKGTGKPLPETITKFMDAAQQVQSSAAQRLNDLADTSAAQVGAIMGKNPSDIKNQLLLPQGTQTRKVKTPGDSLYEKYLKRQGGGNAGSE